LPQPVYITPPADLHDSNLLLQGHFFEDVDCKKSAWLQQRITFLY